MGRLKALEQSCLSAVDVTQERLLILLKENAETEFGKKHEFSEICSVYDYKRKVPFSVFDDYAASVDRMMRGEKHVLTAYPISFYAHTSGTLGRYSMQFIIKAYDGPNMLEKRMEVRPQHLEGMAKLGKHIVCAGGLTDEQGKLKGSALIVDFDDEAGVKEYLAHEPYVVAGVWKDITCEPLNVVLVNGEKYTK